MKEIIKTIKPHKVDINYGASKKGRLFIGTIHYICISFNNDLYGLYLAYDQRMEKFYL